MKRFFISSMIGFAVCTFAYAQSAPRQSKAEQQLRAIEEKRREAIKQGDFQTLGEIYAEDFSAIAGNGQVIGREELFAIFKRNDPRVVFTTDEITVRVFKKTAIFSGRLIGRAPPGGIVSLGRFTHFFVKRKGRWVCVFGQSTPLLIPITRP